MSDFDYTKHGSEELTAEYREQVIHTLNRLRAIDDYWAEFPHGNQARGERDAICTILRSHDRMEAEVKLIAESNGRLRVENQRLRDAAT